MYCALQDQNGYIWFGTQEGLVRFEDRRAEIIDRIPETLRPQFNRKRPVDMREVGPLDLFDPEPTSDVNQMWFRLKDKVDQPPWMHHCLLAYASDIGLLGSANRPHGLAWLAARRCGPAWIMRCGSTTRSALTNGTSTRWTARLPGMHAALTAARSLPPTASWSARWRKRG